METECPDGYTETGECFVIKTWENVTPELYEEAPFTSGWPWCEPGQWPTTYKWEAPCVPMDPCQLNFDSGGRTLWEGKVCDPATHPYVIARGAADPKLDATTTTTTSVVSIADPPAPPTTAMIEVGEPPMLPATGAEAEVALGFGLLGVGGILLGALLVRIAR